MVRSAAAILALILLPSMAQAQAQTPLVHTVVPGNTLWGLSERYYNDPYRWPRIYEANRGVVEDPHWIYPGEELVIPDVLATEQVVQQVTVQPAPAGPVPPAAPPVEAVEPERTVFYLGGAAQGFGVQSTMEQTRLAVSRSVSLAAPWLSPLGVVPVHLGTVVEFTGAEDEHIPRNT